MSDDPFASATIVTDKGFSEITEAPTPGATQEGAQQVRLVERPADDLTPILITDGAQASAEQNPLDGASEEVLPDWINQIPETTFAPATQDGPDELVLDEVTAGDEAFIQASASPQEIAARTQQVKKRIHDVNSARIGRYKAEMRAYQRMATDGQGAVDHQRQPEQTPRMQVQPSTDDPTQLPEYSARARAKAAMDAADPEAYVQARDAYEKASDDYVLAVNRMGHQATTAKLQERDTLAAAQEADHKLAQTWTGDALRPIPWADSTGPKGDKIPGVTTLFQQLINSDPTLPQRIPQGSPLDRAKWIAATVSEAYPRLHAICYERVRAKQMAQIQKKQSAAPTVSGQTNPIKTSQPGASLTTDYLGYINQGR